MVVMYYNQGFTKESTLFLFVAMWYVTLGIVRSKLTCNACVAGHVLPCKKKVVLFADVNVFLGFRFAARRAESEFGLG